MTTLPTSPQRFGAVVGATLMLIVGAVPTFSQPANPGKPAAAQKAAKPKSTTKPAATSGTSDYWSVKYDVRDFETSSRPRVEERTPLSRIPTQTGVGTIGVTTDSSARRGQFHDGRALPGGVDPNTQRESSFVGLSLNMRSDNKAFPIPVPVATPWNRTE